MFFVPKSRLFVLDSGADCATANHKSFTFECRKHTGAKITLFDVFEA
jgi:hypothetical protein